MDNLSHAEREALAELKLAKDIVIKEADKGSSLIIMDKEFYRDKLVLEDHLQTSTYNIVDPIADFRVMLDLKSLMLKHKNCLTSKEFTYITNFEHQTANFYVLPKIHKNKQIIDQIKQQNAEYIQMNPPSDLKGRPIIAGPNAQTRHLSELLHLILAPLVKELPSYIKDDWDFLRKLPHQIDFDCELVTCDIVGLYTNISLDLGTAAIKFWTERSRHLIPSRFTNEFILEAAQFILTNNYFWFDEVLFHQVFGTAMGTIFAPDYACLSVGFLEVTKLYPELHLHYDLPTCELLIKSFFRYLDDGFVPLPKVVDINGFKRILNNLDPNIQYTLEPASFTVSKEGMSSQNINFLDIKIIFHSNGSIETDIYYKETNSHQYLNYNSHHPQHIKDNLPFNLAKRIIIFCSNSDTEKCRLSDLRKWLTNCDYPTSVIDKAFHNAKLQGPAPKPKPKENILPFVTTHFSNYTCHHITKSINQLLTTSRSSRIKEVFNDTNTVLALCQPPNLLRQLSRARYTSNSSAIPKPPGVFKCTNPRCLLCRYYIQECTSFRTANGVEWQVKSHINCHSLCVCYYLKCIVCNNVSYTGKTNVFRLRMNNHISDSRTGNTTDRFDIHVHNCVKKHGVVTEPFFHIYVFLEVSESKYLSSYEKHLHSRNFDTMN